ncbi:MAG: 30S ribosomal protein S17 [Chlamydiae bacterium]|nr:30S ribosomal protein S17 [Chlamydiota bacterium]MBI3266290.1 30S ribosomal protein S17 [Chlamydiota bacterium]
MEARDSRKEKRGVVIQDRMDKTIVVQVERREPHVIYGKVVRKVKKFYVHDEKEEARPGDHVRIQETRPLSKLKRWRLVEIEQKAEGVVPAQREGSVE